ncbi:hypothetical protein NEUTE2DRAFT_97234, partial [Neurospora tetrasperma FGSC 2509]
FFFSPHDTKNFHHNHAVTVSNSDITYQISTANPNLPTTSCPAQSIPATAVVSLTRPLARRALVAKSKADGERLWERTETATEGPGVW